MGRTKGSTNKNKEEQPKSNNLDSKLSELEKNFGLSRASKQIESETIKTNIFAFDFVLGEGIQLCEGGHKIMLSGKPSSGKTTFALRTVARYQELKKTVVWVVSESFHQNWAKQMGVNTETLLLAYPENLEDATETILKLVDKVDLIVVDSVATLVPQTELEKTMHEQTRGLQAKAYSQFCRKLYQRIAHEKTTLILINQIREKMGVLYGCVHGDTKILTNKGNIKIKDIVNKKSKVKVWTFNEENFKLELQPILDYKINGRVTNKEDFVTIKSEGIDTKNGFFSFTVTKNHMILTKNGWQPAQNILIGDWLISKYQRNINPNSSLQKFLAGVFIGDSHISIRSKNTASLKLQNTENKNYQEWKLNKLSSFFKFKKIKNTYITDYNYEFAKIKKEIGNRTPIYLLRNHFSFLGMAIWIMDEGHLDLRNYHCRYKVSVKRYKNNRKMLDTICYMLAERGYNVTYNIKNGLISFDYFSTMKLARKIKKYIPECMQYKLPKKYRKQYKEFELSSKKEIKVAFSRVIDIKKGSNRKIRNPIKYDLIIKNNKNYLVGNSNNGIVIHNSPEITPCGLALKHAVDSHIEFRQGKPIKDGDEKIGVEINLYGKKNKLGVAQRKAIADFYFATGKIDNNKSLFYAGLRFGVIELSGKTYSYGDKRVVGKDNFIQALEDKDWKKIGEEIWKRIK